MYLPKPAFKPVSLAAEFFSLARATEQKNVIQKMCKKTLAPKSLHKAQYKGAKEFRPKQFVSTLGGTNWFP